MNNAKTYSRTTLNGTKWEIVYDGFIASLHMNGYFSGYTFRSVDEANAHLDRIDAKYLAPQPEFKPVAVPADYYNDCNRYYGD